MKGMIFGASGLLGKVLLREWHSDELVGLSSRDVDIRDANRVREVIAQAHPDWIVLAAAYTDVDGCQSHPDLAFAVNRNGPAHLGQITKQVGAKPLLLSSDYVFDAKKT